MTSLHLRKIFTGLLLAFILLSGSPNGLWASDTKVSKHMLDNGLTVLITEMPDNPMVAVFGLVKTGSATEGEFLGSGISHFLEHMLFKGTAERGVGDIPAQVQAVGGKINASTSLDYTIYTITVPAASFDVGLDILSDMLMNSLLDPKEVEKEREVIFNEMRLHEDNPDRRLTQLSFDTVYIEHPYQYPTIGYRPLFAKITHDQLYKYYKLHYSPNNMTISIAGNVKEEDALAKVKEAFGAFERQPELIRNLVDEPQQLSPRRYEENYATPLTRLSMSFDGVSLLDHDLYALDVLANILGQGESSRLYQDLYKQKKLVYAVSASNFTPVDRGAFGVDATLEYKNVEEVIRLVFDHIEKIKEKGISEKDLQKARRQVVAGYIYSSQEVGYMAWTQATDDAFSGDPEFSKNYIQGIEKVSNEDIKRVARQYLKKESSSVVILKPLEEKTADVKDMAVGKETEIIKTVLPNGLTLLVKEDHTFPIVAIDLVGNGGILHEPAELNGITTLMNSVWVDGTKSLSAKDIAELKDQLGMKLSAQPGSNSFGLNMQFLADDQETGLKLLKDLVFEPAFRESEIAIVKDDMKVSLKSVTDNISVFTSKALREALFKTHPYRMDPNGTEESLDRITRADIIDQYHRWMVASNMVLSVFGDVDCAKIIAWAKKTFGPLAKGEAPAGQFAEEPVTNPRLVEKLLDKEQAMVMFGFLAPGIHDKDRYGLDVMCTILGSSFNGRMFAHIREKLGDAYTLGGYYAPGMDIGSIRFYVLTSAQKADKVVELVKQEFQDIQQAAVSPKELADTKMYLKGMFQAGLQTIDNVSSTSSYDELYGLGYDHYLSYEARIDQITAEDVQRLARQYLDLKKEVIVITRPAAQAK